MAITAGHAHKGNGFLLTWANLVTGDPTGDSFAFDGQTDCIVKIQGTFGTATVLIEGSFDGSDFDTVIDPNLAVISTTSLGFYYILTPADFLRPRLTGADGSTNITVFIRAYKRRIS